MSLKTPLQRMADAAAEIDQIADKSVITAADEARINVLSDQFDEAAAERDDSRSLLDSDPLSEPGSIDRRRYKNPWSINRDNSLAARNTSPKELRERALSAAEEMPGASDATRENAAHILEEFDDPQSKLARTALVTSDPDYLKFWVEKLTQGSNALHSEREIQAARRVKAEARAMGLTDTSGGFLIPFQLDPSVIITSDGSFNAIRRISRKVVATGDVWHGVSAGATAWSWDAEFEEVSDDASTFAQPQITIHAARGFVPISYEALADAANVTEEVGRLLSFGRDTLESDAFVTGSGNGEPVGIITALLASSPTVVVDAATNNSFLKEDIYAVDEAIPARYRQSSSAAWIAHRAIWNDADLMETSNGSKLFEGVVGNPGRLLGSPTYEAEAMDGAIVTGDDYVLAYGAFDNYVIADRFSSVELIPHLFGTSDSRPIGARGFFAFFRIGADSVNDAAFRLLKV